MQSVNHQFVEFGDQVVARYVKTRLEPLMGFRLNPRNAINPNDRIDFLLATPEDNVQFTPYSDGQPTVVTATRLTYADEVLELYSDVEVRAFERMNRLLIENGLLIPYHSTAPDVDTTNSLNDSELRALAKIKTLDVFKARVQSLTSIHTLQALLTVMDSIESVTNAQMKVVKQHIHELNRSKNT